MGGGGGGAARRHLVAPWRLPTHVSAPGPLDARKCAVLDALPRFPVGAHCRKRLAESRIWSHDVRR